MQPHQKRRLIAVVVTIAAVWVVLVATLLTARRRLHAGGPTGEATATPPPVGGKLPVLWNLPKFSFEDQKGTTVTDQSLRGRVLITDFIFTRCTTVCPLTTAKMNLLRRKITRPDVRFVSFSVDPDYDKPDKLAAYAERWKGDARWILLSTTPDGLKQVADGMKVTVAKSGDPDNPIIHSSLFFLVDGEGRVRGVYNSDDDDALKRLASEAAELEKTSASASAPVAASVAQGGDSAARGMQLFESVGCAGCHGVARVAPPLAGLEGRHVKLQDGTSIVADQAYIRRSIVDPAAQIADGFVLSMPVYRGALTDAQVDDLVAYIESLPAPPSAAASAPTVPAAATEQAVDPVCGMKVVANSTAPHVERAGKTYFFCSDLCRDRFVKDPALFVKP